MVVGSLNRPLASKLCSHSGEPTTEHGLPLWEQSLLAMASVQAPSQASFAPTEKIAVGC